MSAPTSEPRIYVACLATYNAGKLHGEWIDADQDAEDIWAEVQAMLKESREPNAEEWAIHDYEGFHGISIHEWESFETVSKLAALLAEHGAAFAAWYDYIHCEGDPPDEGFEDSYCGEWESARDYAENFAEDCGYISEFENNPLVYCIDWDAFVRTLEQDHHFVRVSSSSVHVFRSY